VNFFQNRYTTSFTGPSERSLCVGSRPRYLWAEVSSSAAQYARPLLDWHAQWSHSHILAGVLSCPWMSTMARRRARGAEDGTCTAPLHHVAAVRRRTLAMSTASARWGAARQLGRTSPRGGPPVPGCRDLLCSGAVRTNAMQICNTQCVCLVWTGLHAQAPAPGPFKCQIFFLAFAKRFSNA